MPDSTNPTQSKPGWDDFVYDAFSTAAIGGSLVALFFLLVDSVRGEPLFTPSLMGSVLFEGVAANDVSEVQMSMVAAYSTVHFATFGLLGMLVAFAIREVELHGRNPVGVLLGLFLLFEWMFFIGTLTLMPGVMEVLGVARVTMANLLAAGGIALFLVHEHRPEVWQRWRTLRA
jgi:hypothetical protein